MRCFRESIKHNDGYLIPHLNIGRILRDQKKFAEAADAFKLAKRSCDTPNSCGIVYNALGLINADLKQWRDSADAHEHACKLQPHQTAWRNQLQYAKAMLAANPGSGATGGGSAAPKIERKGASKAADTTPKGGGGDLSSGGDSEALFAQGHALLQAGKTEEAASKLAASLSANPNQPVERCVGARARA